MRFIAKGLDKYTEESYDDYALDYDYDYTFDYADWLLTMGRTFRKGNKILTVASPSYVKTHHFKILNMMKVSRLQNLWNQALES